MGWLFAFGEVGIVGIDGGVGEWGSGGVEGVGELGIPIHDSCVG